MITAEDRDMLILRMVGQGLSDKRIAAILALPEKSITELRKAATARRRAATGDVLETVAGAS